MSKFFLFLLFGFISCINTKDKIFVPQKEIQGDWLILYPKHILKNELQKKIYGIAQDSIINLLGLKLITFSNTGEFSQIDSLFGRHGTWKIADTGNIRISSAGKGFENFNGTIAGVINDTILVEEIVRIKDENIKLVWHLKKIKGSSEGSDLFKTKNNLWRRKPLKKETAQEIKERIIAMLKYYSLYFKIVSEESIYFSPVRVFLPFTYYQHGVGLTGFTTNFSDCFYDAGDAEKGYNFLRQAFESTEDLEFPSGHNFVIEYSQYFQRLADYVE